MQKGSLVPFPLAPITCGVQKPKKRDIGAIGVDADTSKNVISAGKDESDNRKLIRLQDLSVLKKFSPVIHAYSLRLAAEVESVARKLPREISACRVCSEGLVEFDVKLDGNNGYGCFDWCFRIGGRAGDDACPVFARFTTPIAHYRVDDLGCVDRHFWASLNTTSFEPPLRQIMEGVVRMLHGPYSQGEEDYDSCLDSAGREKEQWIEARDYTVRKVSSIRSYQAIALHPYLVDDSLSSWYNMSWFAPDFLEIVEICNSLKNTRMMPCGKVAIDLERRLEALVTENSAGIFSFNLFTDEFCDMIVAEIDNFEVSGLPRRRPNTMNNYGHIAHEVGMQRTMTLLMQFIVPLVETVFPNETVAYGLDHHHSFVVQYISDHSKGDRGLDMHHDASEVTVNVCLGRDNFKGGDLLFCGHAGSSSHRKYQFSYAHVKGRAVLHLGRHRHGAEDIIQADSSEEHSNAERLNYIMWLRSSVFRSAAGFGHIMPDGYPKDSELTDPDLCCLSRFNDDDYNEKKSKYAIVTAVTS